MHRRRQPANLQQLAIKTIVASVVKLARRLMANVYKRRRGLRLFFSSNHHQIKGIADLREHLYDALPVSLCNILCSQVMSALNTVAREQSTFDDARKYVFCKLLERVLHPSIEYLNLSDWPHSVAGVLLTNLKELTGLKVLSAHGVTGAAKWLTADTVVHLPMLTCVDLREVATDSLVSILTSACRQLKELRLAWSDAVTDRSITALLKTNLHRLDVVDTGISINGVQALLLGIQNLHELSMNLEFPVQTMLSMKNVSALRNLRLVDPDSEAAIEFVVKCCPYLTRLELVGSVDTLQPLSNLQYLQEISIDIGGLDGVNVIRILESANISKLKRLSICNGMNINLQHLGEIFVFLHHLDLKHCTYLETSSFHNNDNFTCLKVLTVSSVDDNEVGRALATILPQVVKSLHTLKLDIVMDPGSHIIGNLLLANTMVCLEILEIRGIVTMTVSTVNRLIKTHESLKTIGKSEFWNRITKEDLSLLIDDLRFENIDLDIY